MLIFQPIETCVLSNDVADNEIVTIWEPSYFHAEFQPISDDSKRLRIAFNNETIVRILDEMPLSTESDSSEWIGLVPGHFAYIVSGDKFAAAQSEVWLSTYKPTHYRFVTGWACLDVLSSDPPIFSIEQRAVRVLT